MSQVNKLLFASDTTLSLTQQQAVPRLKHQAGAEGSGFRVKDQGGWSELPKTPQYPKWDLVRVLCPTTGKPASPFNLPGSHILASTPQGLYSQLLFTWRGMSSAQKHEPQLLSSKKTQLKETVPPPHLLGKAHVCTYTHLYRPVQAGEFGRQIPHGGWVLSQPDGSFSPFFDEDIRHHKEDIHG